MALLETLIITGGGEPILGAGNAFDKINTTIGAVNDTVGGGTTGQVLIKASDDDFDTVWDTITGTLPPQGGNAGKFLTTDATDASWVDVDQISDGTNLIKMKVLDIGTWNMNTDANKYVTHGIPDWTKILSVQAIIVNDANDKRYPWTQRGESGLESSGIEFINSTQVRLYRTNAGSGGTDFDSSAFSSTGSSRGYLIVTYLG
ncbi:MAG: hypothetical protein V4687_16120 [Bacteroidota bacterium]